MSKITIICGEKQSGKTTYLINLIKAKKTAGFNYEGFVAMGTFKDESRNSFRLIDILTNEEMLFMSTQPILNADQLGKFYINPEGIVFGETLLDKATKSDCKGVVIDEIGPLELSNKGWANQLKQLLKTDKKIIITVRTSLLNSVLQYFKLTDFVVINI